MKNKSITTQSVFPYFQKNGLKINYKKGCQFFRPEDSPQGIYYLESGQAMLSSTKLNGTEQILAIGESGSIFGKVGSVITQPDTNVTAQSITDCVVYRLGCKDTELIATEPIAGTAYMKQVAYNNVYLLSQVLILGEKDIYLRVISELLLLAEFHGDTYDNQSCCLRVSLTQNQLASMICISREYLSKTLKKIKEKRLIIDDGRYIKIPNLDTLKHELD